MQKEIKVKAAKTINQNSTTSKKIVDLTLTSLSKKLDNVKEKEIKDRSTIYLYPENFTKEMIGGIEGKKFRNARRKSLEKSANNIAVFAKRYNNVTKTEENKNVLLGEIEKFKADYKTFYSNNDFTLKSLSNSNNEIKGENIALMLEIIALVK